MNSILTLTTEILEIKSDFKPLYKKVSKISFSIVKYKC